MTRRPTLIQVGTTLHHGTTFVISDDAGDLGSASQGYYCDDIRHLSRLALELDDLPAVQLTTRRADDAGAVYHLTNPRLDGAPEATLAIVRRIELDGARHGALHEEIAIENFGDGEARFTLALVFDSDFAEIFEVKKWVESGVAPPHRGRARVERDGARRRVSLRRVVAGGECETELCFSRPPRLSGHAARFDVALPRRGSFRLSVEVTTRRHGRHDVDGSRVGAPAPTSIDTDHRVLMAAYAQAAHDLQTLASRGAEAGMAICGGIPWYMALFGRDTLIAAFESLLHDPSLTRRSLETLAALQGSRDDPETAEEPGKILHEHRPELESSARKDVPRYPYYATIDATPLFVITLSEYVRWTADVSFAERLWPNVERAVAWILRRCERGGGLVAYDSCAGGSVRNQGWKDSPDSVRFADGRIATGEIALVEVQGYCADALDRAAELGALVRRGGGDEWRARARRLRATIDERFWLPRRQTFAEALAGGVPVDALTSNPGHLLFSGAISEARAACVAEALLSPAMFSGFGVRTMGTDEGGYNPISYHNGSVWPHDNALFALGLRRYRLDAAARRVLAAMLDALASFPRSRPPELYCGFDRAQASIPISYPDANIPQAWATGSVLLVPRLVAGIEVDARVRRVSIDPLRLDGLTRLCIDGLPVAGARVRLELGWTGEGCRARVARLPAGWHLDAPRAVTVDARD